MFYFVDKSELQVYTKGILNIHFLSENIVNSEIKNHHVLEIM